VTSIEHADIDATSAAGGAVVPAGRHDLPLVTSDDLDRS
jgi:hypothetical protein